MTKRKLTKHEDDILRNIRKSADIYPSQSPQELRDTIEEQNAQIEALKRDLLEQIVAFRSQFANSEQENARLNNYIERLEVRNAELVPENARLKAEVERLTFDPLTYLDDQGEWMPRHIHLAAVERLKAENERLKAMDSLKTVSLTDSTNWQAIGDYAEAKEENARLKAENERLRKAGNEVIHEWSSGHGTDVENFTKALWIWAVAKEGKPSV